MMIIIFIFFAIIYGIYKAAMYADSSNDSASKNAMLKENSSSIKIDYDNHSTAKHSTTATVKVSDIRPSEISKIKGNKPSSCSTHSGSSSCTISTVKRGTTQWHNLRQGKVTGSSAYYLKDAPVIYAIRQGTLDERHYSGGNYAIERALKLKPQGAAAFAKETGLPMSNASFAVSKKHKKAGFSPDGIIFNNNNIDSIVLVKAFGKTHHLSCYRNIDEKIQYQLQFGMFVTGANSAYLALYNPDCSARDRLLVRKIYRDNSFQSLFEKRFNEYEKSI